MRKLTLALLAVACIWSAIPAAADICTPDAVPAATLLLPYFEVDLANQTGITTLFSVNNASATAVLAHVVIWSDLSVPVLDFDIYLTGYDVQTINLRDIFVDGRIPRTASAGQDPTDTISNKGNLSQDINFASCNVQLPPPTTSVGSLYIAHMQAALTGEFSPLLGGCAGQFFGDSIARGYITVDTVNQCSLLFPGDPGYFGAAVTFQNVLWGDYTFVDPANNFAQGDVLVHIEAAQPGGTGIPFDQGPLYPAFLAGDHTFYSRYVAATAADGREPLPSVYGIRYITGGAFSGGTDLIVWRDATVAQNTFACGGSPAWYPLSANDIVAFDEQEDVFVGSGCTVSPCPPGSTPFPAEAQRVAVGSDALQTGADFGWLYLNLNHTFAGNFDVPFAQAFVSATVSSEGRFSYGLQAVSLNNLCNPTDVILVP